MNLEASLFVFSCSVTSDSLQPHGQPTLSVGFSRQEYWSG